MIELTLKKKKITMAEIAMIGLKPDCTSCTHSQPEGYPYLSCDRHERKIFSLTENLCPGECKYFEADFEEFFMGQPYDVRVHYRDTIYEYRHSKE